MSNTQLFSAVAREYANYRPGYPPELFAWLASVCNSRDAVWDCGCGSGQASVPLAAHFERVFATDASTEQIAAASPHERITYSVAPAERSGLAGNSVDLVTVAQALHWFDLRAFYAEALRVVRSGALIAAWTYPRPRFVNTDLDSAFEHFYTHIVGPYWPPERRHIEAEYRTLAFPFEEIAAPAFALTLEWSLEHVLGYVSSWSATARYRKTQGTDPLPMLRSSLEPLWPRSEPLQPLRMALALRVGKFGYLCRAPW